MPIPLFVIVAYSVMHAHMISVSNEDVLVETNEDEEQQQQQRRQQEIQEENAIVAKRLEQYESVQQLESTGMIHPQDSIEVYNKMEQPSHDEWSATALPSSLSPNRLICPLSNQLLKHPVVLPNGHSYERSIIVESRQCADVDSEDDIYRNRALEEVLQHIQQTLSNDDHDDVDGVSGTTKEKDCDEEGGEDGTDNLSASKRKNNNNSYDKTARAPSGSSLPDCVFCPITTDLMLNPVIDPEGYSYERSAIVRWILENHTSPITRAPLRVHQLYENKALQRFVVAEVARMKEEKQEETPESEASGSKTGRTSKIEKALKSVMATVYKVLTKIQWEVQMEVQAESPHGAQSEYQLESQSGGRSEEVQTEVQSDVPVGIRSESQLEDSPQVPLAIQPGMLSAARVLDISSQCAAVHQRPTKAKRSRTFSRKGGAVLRVSRINF